MEVLGRFQYHVIGGATGSGKGKLLDCLRDQGGQVIRNALAAYSMFFSYTLCTFGFSCRTTQVCSPERCTAHLLRRNSKRCQQSLILKAFWLLLIPQDYENVASVNMSPVRHLGNDGSDVEQVVDLEVAADHRGSILGDHPTRLQPPQKMFESKLLHQMRNFSVDRPVFIESESSLVGRRQVPAAMWKVNLPCQVQLCLTHSILLLMQTSPARHAWT